MSRQNSTLLSCLVALAVFFSGCTGLSTKNHKPLVFALNLSTASVSLALVKSDTVLAEFGNLAPRESRSLQKVEASEGVVLRHGAAGQSPDQSWTDPSGTPYALRLEVGHSYALIVDPLGQASLYVVPEKWSSDPKLCVVNVTGLTLSQVQAAPEWAKNVKVYVQDLVPLVPSEFYSLDPKTLGLYWQTVDQAVSGNHTVAQGSDGKALRQTFLADHWYLFLAGDGAVRDVTPTLD